MADANVTMYSVHACLTITKCNNTCDKITLEIDLKIHKGVMKLSVKYGFT